MSISEPGVEGFPAVASGGDEGNRVVRGVRGSGSGGVPVLRVLGVQGGFEDSGEEGVDEVGAGMADFETTRALAVEPEDAVLLGIHEAAVEFGPLFWGRVRHRWRAGVKRVFA